MGRKHQLMLQLAAQLGDGRYRAETISELIGPPDYAVQPGDDLFEFISRSPDVDASAATTYQYLVYTWRGTHDFLFFVSDNGRVIDAGWWYAGE
jgi:hypothetical protein